MGEGECTIWALPGVGLACHGQEDACGAVAVAGRIVGVVDDDAALGIAVKEFVGSIACGFYVGVESAAAGQGVVAFATDEGVFAAATYEQVVVEVVAAAVVVRACIKDLHCCRITAVVDGGGVDEGGDLDAIGYRGVEPFDEGVAGGD